ncbi:MAG TPA: Ig-like domain-containing protein [Actinomycetota bacterium]|nr:Ig-like domain-containing protein [Actinomycetota bacterium]
MRVRFRPGRPVVALAVLALVGLVVSGGAVSALGPSNAAPIAYNQVFSTTQGSPQEITLYAADPDGDALTYIVTSEPQHGTLSGVAPGFLYTPAPGYAGPDSFTWRASDGQAESSSATTSVNIAATTQTGVDFRGARTAATTLGTTLQINKPVGVVEGDFMLLHVSVVLVGSLAPPPQQVGFPPPTPPAGWTLVRSTDLGTVMRGVVYKRRATATDAAKTSYTVTFVQPVLASGAIAAWSGVDPTNPIGDIKDATSPLGSSLTVPSVFGRAGGRAVATFAVVGGPVTRPPFMIERWEISSSGNRDGLIATSEGADQALAADGQTGDRTATAGLGVAWIGHLIALRPAPVV